MAIDDVGNILLVVSKKVDGGRGGLVADCGGGQLWWLVVEGSGWTLIMSVKFGGGGD